MESDFFKQNEDAMLRAAHPAYAAFCADDAPAYDTQGGAWDYECDRWEQYDDMEGGRWS